MWDLEKYKNRVAAIDDNEDKLLYSEIAELSNELRGEARRKLCFVLCKNRIGSLAGYVAMIEADVVPVMLASDMGRELLLNLIHSYQPEYIWGDGSVEDIALENSELNSTSIQCRDYVLYRTDFSSEIPIDDQLALLLTTSGSTGSPKFVRQSYENIKANTLSIIEYLGIDENERPITTLPMNYTYGLSIINTHIYMGATILITDKSLMDRGFWTFFKDGGATSFGGVPYTYEMLDKLRLYRMQLPTLKTMTQAGGKLSIALHEKLAKYASETGRSFVVMYGQTEATARMGYLPADKALEKIGSMGIAIPGGSFTLLGADGESITEPDQVGELIYRGANVTLGYSVCREDLSKGDERGGVLETGDMAKFDEDGYYYIVGRKKRFLKIYGKRINLDEIERLVKADYPEIDVAATGEDDHLVVYITDEAILKEVKLSLATKIQINIAAISVEYIKSIPRSTSGKVLYSELKN